MSTMSSTIPPIPEAIRQTRKVFRIVDANGTRLSTGIALPNGFLQVKPLKALFPSQASWITTVVNSNPSAIITIQVSESHSVISYRKMTDEQRKVWYPYWQELCRAKRAAKEAKKVAALKDMLAKENDTVRSIRSLYEYHGLPDSLFIRIFRANRRDPGLYIEHNGMYKPVFFHRQTGIAAIPIWSPNDKRNVLTRISEVIPNARFVIQSTLGGYIAIQQVIPDLSVPNPGQKTVVYIPEYRGSFSPFDTRAIAALKAKGFFIKVVRSTGPYVMCGTGIYQYDPDVYEMIAATYEATKNNVIITYKTKDASRIHFTNWLNSVTA